MCYFYIQQHIKEKYFFGNIDQGKEGRTEEMITSEYTFLISYILKGLYIFIILVSLSLYGLSTYINIYLNLWSSHANQRRSISRRVLMCERERIYRKRSPKVQRTVQVLVKILSFSITAHYYDVPYHWGIWLFTVNLLSQTLKNRLCSLFKIQLS